MMAIAWYGPVWAGSSLSVHVREAPIRSVLEGLARSGNINLIVDDTVQGTMTMHINGVTVEDALDAIAASQNLYYEKEGPVADHDGREETGWSEIPADVEAPLRRPDRRAGGRPGYGARRRRPLLRRYEYARRRRDAAGASRRAGPRHGVDTKPRQVDVEVEIASIDRSALRHAGVEWNWSSVSGGAGHEGFSFATQIQALEEKGQASVLARPRMAALNGREASVLIGDKIPVVTEYMSGGEKTATTEYKNVGVKLRYVPRIHDDGTVTAAIELKSARLYLSMK